MKAKHREQLSEFLHSNPSEISTALNELEIFYVVRECLNRADLARVGDFGSNGMRTGANEYDNETLNIFRHLIEAHDLKRVIDKEDVLTLVDEVFQQAFSQSYERSKLAKIANAIYNELHKIYLDIRGRRFQITSEDGFQNNIQ